jgi:uncharacterized protein
MHTFSKSLMTFFSWIVNNPLKIIIVSSILLMIFSIGLSKLTISNDFRVYLSKDNPQLLAFESFENNYVSSDSATLVIENKQGDLFNLRSLQLIEQATELAWQIDGAYRVSSLTNYQYTRSQNDEIETNYLVESTEGMTLSQLNKLKEIALSENRLVKSLITADGKLTVVVINLRLDKSLNNASTIVTLQMESLRNKLRQQFPEFEIDNGGSTAFNTTLARAVANDLTTLVPISYVLIFLGLVLFLKRLSGTVATFLLITACLVSTFGFFGWISPVLTPIAGFAPSILLSIMVADSVHIITSYYQFRASDDDKKSALIKSLSINYTPVLVTSITTIIGFLTLNFSSSPPYQDLGNMVAFGVLLALVFSIFLLPALLIVIPENKPFLSKENMQFKGFSDWIIGHRKKILASMLLAVIFLTVSIPKNKLSDNWSQYFDQSFEVVKLVKKVDGYLTGVNSLEYSISSSTKQGIFSPEYISQLDQFEQWFLTQKKVVKVSSFSQLMKDLNKTMHNDSFSEYKIPQTSELAAQYLLFYEFGLPAELGLNNLVTIHKDATRFSVSVTDAGSDELLALDTKAQAWLKQNAPALVTSEATGLGMVFAHIAQRNISSLLVGTLLALLGISAILVLIFKSLKFGLISLIPNIIPAAMAYGLWGILYGYVDISLSIVACSTLGIVVDDTVHFLHKYRLARLSGLTSQEAIRATFSRVGKALLTTTVVLSGGFMILAISHMNTSAAIGMLMAITLVFALIVDFLLLPPLLLILDKYQLAGSTKKQVGD